MEITIKDLYYLMLRNLMKLVIGMLVGFLVAFLYTTFYINPTYVNQSSLIIRSENGASIKDDTTTQQKFYQTMTNTCVAVLSTNDYYEKVSGYISEKYNTTISAKTIGNCVSYTIGEETPVFYLRVSMSSPSSVYHVAEAIHALALDELNDKQQPISCYTLQSPQQPKTQSSPNKAINSIIGALAGLALVIGVLVLAEVYNSKIQSQKDIESRVDIPVLGVIPKYNSKKQKKNKKKGSHSVVEEIDNIELKIANTSTNEVDKRIYFAVVEAYKTLRTNVHFSLVNDGCKVIAITSSAVGEGKTTTAANLSIALAQTGLKVLLVDADMRKANLSGYYKFRNENGISDVLANDVAYKDCLKNVSENFCILPAGNIPPNPSELLSSENAGKFFSEARQHFDYIIIDTPPVNIVPDALGLVSFIDGVVVITRENYTTYSQLDAAVKKLQFTSANLIGVVLNDSVLNDENGYYHNRKNYGKYAYTRYGYSYSNGYGYD